MQTQTEIIARTCFPLFEPFIESALQQATATTTDFRIVCSGIYEIGPKFGHGGICLEAVQLPLDDVTLGAGFHIFGLEADSPPTLRVTVGWQRTWTCDSKAGFSIAEFAISCRLSEPDAARAWVSDVLPNLHRATSVAIERGRPPSHAKHWFQRVLGRVPPAQIMTLPSGGLRRFPDIATFKQTYDNPHH